MRQAGTLPAKQDAQRFASYLLTLGITSKIEPAGDAWSIWIHDENQLERGRQELEEFRRLPEDPRYQAAQKGAAEVRRETERRERQAQRNYIDMRNEWAKPWRRRYVTVAMVLASIAVAVITDLGANHDKNLYFYISTNQDRLTNLEQGEIWRLITPIFLHFGFVHILFNMMWLLDLGSMIELKLGSVRYALLVLMIAVISNLAQYYVSGSGFGGMSGVVYGLFGYIWIRGRFDPTCGLYVRPDVVALMIIWFFVCLAGWIGHVANTAHGVGLVVGAAAGYLSWLISRSRLR